MPTIRKDRWIPPLIPGIDNHYVSLVVRSNKKTSHHIYTIVIQPFQLLKMGGVLTFVQQSAPVWVDASHMYVRIWRDAEECIGIGQVDGTDVSSYA